MDRKIREQFLQLWKRYFNASPLPIAFYYTDEDGRADVVDRPSDHRCVIADLSKARAGRSICFDTESIGCSGGKKYFGFTEAVMPNFEYFLSCGLPGKVEGERYKKTPELVKQAMRHFPQFEAPARFIVFKRWDALGASDDPDVVIFFSPPDVLSGLFTLTNFDEEEPNGVFAPFCAGCASIVQYPYLEKDTNRPRAVLGLFDVSARPWVPGEVLTFSVPMKKFLRMVQNMEESFLTTASWNKVKRRLKG
ncbi:MAG: hypothetical protein GTN74_04375 [Proteobacteria bacterium]|nr:hypothetical protein [Pseudomonadota bacterium]NIS68588.1 hypothetical protein [Pseudomonadota bacterium]